MASSDEKQPKRVTMQISAAAGERLDDVAKKSGLSRPRIVEHLITRQNARDLVRLLKAEKVEPKPAGRPKMSVFKPR